MNLTANQVQVGNVFMAINHKGEMVERRLVGGTFGTVTKYFTLDAENKLKSNARGTIEEVLDGYGIKSIEPYDFCITGRTAYAPEDIDCFRRGDVILVNVDGETVYRQLSGGKQFETTAWFAIDPITGERKSKTTYENSDDVANAYDIKLVLR